MLHIKHQYFFHPRFQHIEKIGLKRVIYYLRLLVLLFFFSCPRFICSRESKCCFHYQNKRERVREEKKMSQRSQVQNMFTEMDGSKTIFYCTRQSFNIPVSMASKCAFINIPCASSFSSSSPLPLLFLFLHREQRHRNSGGDEQLGWSKGGGWETGVH